MRFALSLVLVGPRRLRHSRSACPATIADRTRSRPRSAPRFPTTPRAGARSSRARGQGRGPVSICAASRCRPTSKPGASIDFDYYDVDGAESARRSIVLLPIFNGQLSITRYFARYFANQGWAADRGRARARSARGDVRSGERRSARTSPSTAACSIGWSSSPSSIAAASALFGISFGAMDAVMLTALDDRVDALVAAMAGGDLASLMMSTNYRRIVRRVRRHARRIPA